MRKHVHIDPKCLALSLVPSAIEEYHKEVSGYLIGSNGSQASRLKVISAYPIQSDIKKRTWVMHGNESAVKRINGLMKTMNMKLIGGFHTHPLGPSRPSASDVEFIRERLEEYALPHWFELIMSVKKKYYSSPQDPGWGMRNYHNKIGMTIKPTPWMGFDVTLSGFWVRTKGRLKEATIWSSKKSSF